LDQGCPSATDYVTQRLRKIFQREFRAIWENVIASSRPRLRWRAEDHATVRVGKITKMSGPRYVDWFGPSMCSACRRSRCLVDRREGMPLAQINGKPFDEAPRVAAAIKTVLIFTLCGRL
jgi:hypothetical protein